MSKILTVPPTQIPVSLEIAKANLRVDGNDMDLLITSWIEGIVAAMEHEIGMFVMPQTWKVTNDGFAGEISLPHPVISVVSVTYLDANNVTQTLPASAYRINRQQYQTTLTPVYGTSWPTTYGEFGAVVITVECGYASINDVPRNVKLYILAKLVEQFDPATRLENDTVQSHYVSRLLDACRTYQ